MSSLNKRALDIHTLWAMERLSNPAVSPDGRWVVFTVTRFKDEEDKSLSDLWLVPSDGGEAPRRLTWDGGNDKGARWSPDGRSLVFVSKRGEDDPAQLFSLPMAGGEAEPLTELPIAVRDFRWFPDSRRIALVASTWPDLNDDFEAVKKRVQEEKDDKTKVKATDRRLLRFWDSYATSGRVPHFFVLDLESREVRDLTPGWDALTGFKNVAWDLSPEGDEIAFAANVTAPPWREITFKLHLVPTAGGPVAPFPGGVEAPGWDGQPVYTPDGRYLLFGRTPRPHIPADFTRLMRYDRGSGEVVELTPGWDAEASDWRPTRDGEAVVFHAQEKGRGNLYTLPIEGGTPRLLVAGGTTGEVAEGEDGRLVFLLESLTEPAELAAVDVDEVGGDEVRRLTAMNGERLAGLDLGTVEDVTFTGAEGDPVQMWVMKPPGFDPGKRWPLVVLIHGGPHSAWLDSFHYRWSTALFAAQGWVTAAVNFHGSTGFGQAFAESILGEHARKPFADVMRATDVLLESGYVDPERTAAAGGSFGGYMVSWILGHSDRYAALVNHAGVYDLMAQFASDYTWSRGSHYGAEPWEDPSRIDLYSPSRFAEHFATPTLILHGELDYRVPVTQGINLHHVLCGKGVPSRIVVFPNENHWITKPRAAEVWWREVLGWLGKYLGEEPVGGDHDDD